LGGRGRHFGRTGDVHRVLPDGECLEGRVVPSAALPGQHPEPTRAERVGELGDGEDALLILVLDVEGPQALEQAEVVPRDGVRPALVLVLARRAVAAEGGGRWG